MGVPIDGFNCVFIRVGSGGQEAFNNIVTDHNVSILNGVKVQNLEHFISHWKIELWEFSNLS